LINSPLKDGLQCPSVHMDAFATSLTCCDLDLQNLVRSLAGASEYFLLSFVKIARAIHEISW